MPVNNLPYLPGFGVETPNCNADKVRTDIWKTRLNNSADALIRIAITTSCGKTCFENYVRKKIDAKFDEAIKKSRLGNLFNNADQKKAKIFKIYTAPNNIKFQSVLKDQINNFWTDNSTKILFAIKVISEVNRIVGYIPVISFFAGLNQLIELGVMNINDRIAASWSGKKAPVVEHKGAHVWNSVIKMTGCGFVLIPFDIALLVKRSLVDPKTTIAAKSWLAL